MTAPERVGVGARQMNGGGLPGMGLMQVRDAETEPRPEARAPESGARDARPHPGRGGHDGLRPSPPTRPREHFVCKTQL